MTNKKETVPLPEDLRVFLTVIRKAGFAAAADELGLSPAYVSKRIQILETTLATRLLHRTSRRFSNKLKPTETNLAPLPPCTTRCCRRC